MSTYEHSKHITSRITISRKWRGKAWNIVSCQGRACGKICTMAAWLLNAQLHAVELQKFPRRAQSLSMPTKKLSSNGSWKNNLKRLKKSSEPTHTNDNSWNRILSRSSCGAIPALENPFTP